jgi:hypothetical protein
VTNNPSSKYFSKKGKKFSPKKVTLGWWSSLKILLV